MASWSEPFNGKTWQDMPGQNSEDKKLNFSLFRRGQINLADFEVDAGGKTKLQRNFLAGTFSKGNQLAAMRRRAALRDQQWTMAPPRPATDETDETVVPKTNEPAKEDEPMFEGITPETETRNKAIRERFVRLHKPYGFVKRFAASVKVHAPTFYSWISGHNCGEEILGKIEQGVLAEEHGKGLPAKVLVRRPKSAESVVVHGAPDFLRPPPSEVVTCVTFEEVQSAFARWDDARKECDRLMRAYVAQGEGRAG